MAPGFTIEKVAGRPVGRYPMFAALDDRGRLFVAEGTGTNLPGADLMKFPKKLGRITLPQVWRCRVDGTEIERLCGGGFDNPVELAFTSEGEMIGAMDQRPGDALLHYAEQLRSQTETSRRRRKHT